MTAPTNRIERPEIGLDSASVLQFCTVDSAHARRSGYDLLGEYTHETHLLRMPRLAHFRLVDRAIGRALRYFSISDWYYRSSWVAEREARRLACTQSLKMVHYLWGERDLGFLRAWPRSMRRMATFHLPTRDLKTVIHRPQALHQLDAIVLMCNSQAEFFLDLGLPPSKLHVILHGVDSDYFCPPKSASTNPGRFEILSVGNYMRDFALLEEVCRACANEPEIIFRIIASPAYRAPFESLPNVRFDCGLTDAELLDAYRQADCFLMLVEDSTANNAVMEAMACGLPIVTQSKGGLPDYVTENEGYLTHDDSAEEVVAALSIFKNNETLRREKSRSARLRAESLNWNCAAKVTEQLYRTLLS